MPFVCLVQINATSFTITLGDSDGLISLAPVEFDGLRVLIIPTPTERGTDSLRADSPL